MKCNVGTIEKIIRFFLGMLFLWLGYEISGLFYILSLIFFVTAAIGFCPINKILGINTCEKKKDNTQTGPEETTE